MESGKASQYREELAYWLALSERPSSITPGMLATANHELGSLRALWEAPDRYLESLGLTERNIPAFRKVMSGIKIADLHKQLDECSAKGIEITRFVDDDYPPLLRNIGRTPEWPPLLLFKRGSMTDFGRCVAIVGTRNCSFHARVAAIEFARELASAGYTIVSGLARGIDEFAHVGALMPKKGKTVAVLPFLEPVYPPEHEELRDDIMSRGAVISERYVLQFQKSIREKLVHRNRITSGISQCVIAVESGVEGGTVRQVEFALAQGKTVFAVASKEKERLRKGFELFVTKGAIPVKAVDEVLEWLKNGQTASKAQSLERFHEKAQETIDSGWEEAR